MMWDYRVKQRMAFISILHPNGITLLTAYQPGVTRRPQGGAVQMVQHSSQRLLRWLKANQQTACTERGFVPVCSQLSSYQLSGEV